MSVFFEQAYTVNSKDKTYIQRIAKYNSHVRITHINDEKCSEIMLGHQLPEIIAKNAAEEKENIIKIRCLSANSDSALGILPPLPTDFDKTITAIKKGMDKKEQKHTSDAVTKLLLYIGFSTGNDDKYSLDPPIIDNLSQQQALLILDHIHPTGALHLPSQNEIIFEYNKTIFEFTYGKHAYIQRGILRFDVDDGFSPSHPDEAHPVEDQLNKFFMKWKENNYSDSIIPSYNCLDTTKEGKNKNVVSASSSLFNQQHKRKHDDIDLNNIIEARTRSQFKASLG